MGSKYELNEMIDKIVENVESALEKLGGSITEEDKIKSEKQCPSDSKHPYPSIRYPIPKDSVVEENIEENAIEIIKQESIPEPPKPKIEREEKAVIKPDIFSNLKEENQINQENEEDISHDSEIHFIDIEREVRLIHLYGPPGVGKTTLALQSAIEILPKETFYIITSHSTSILKRIKQMVIDDRWKDYPDLKQHFFPIQIQSLRELQHQIEQIINFSSHEIGMVVIDHITDYIRGETHKEENRDILRRIFENLYILTNKKKCKVLIINGYAYKGSAPAEDLIESFCDLTIKITNERKDFEIEID
ncbi:MAG: AAA family ATPase, partial [Candidatus Heimdallarchaeota archaeon]|nr:AAA family ATPase [Candidatus Heimdallarchaeota archaeon]MCK4878696.1 AAA family ATPase [Candidatus Heimdallarchaeota archaeon]